MPTVWLEVDCTSPAFASPIWFWFGTNCGSLFRVASTVGLEVFWKACELTVTIGLLEVKSRRVMREPVTTTSEVDAAGAGGAAAWAWAEPAMAMPARMAVDPIRADLLIRRATGLPCI